MTIHHNLKQNTPSYRTAGEMLLEHLEAIGMKQSDLCNQTGIAKPVDKRFGMTLELFEVSSAEGIETLAKEEQSEAHYKKSERLIIDPKALFTWKYYCFHEADRHPLSPKRAVSRDAR